MAQRFSSPVAAWLGGSVVRGTATALSDLDITVPLDGTPAPMRESLRADGVPVERVRPYRIVGVLPGHGSGS
ncbi:nucleotidyltransferase domain-containing protein [Yimella sp. RIT 621]|nr:nucleotidyltransferase domain-containing protein [Yimella sp. RIT 621]